MDDFALDLDRQRHPLVMRGAVRAWPAFSSWTFTALRARCGDVRVPVHTGRYRRSGAGAARDGYATTTRVADFVDALESGRAVGYLAGYELLRAAPALRRELAFPSSSRWPTAVEVMWLGGAGTLTQLHFDRAQNLNAQLVGRKRFSLFAPTRTDLHPRRVTWSHSMSDLDLDEPERFVAHGCAPDVEIELSAGDLLFIPYGWWHRVVTLEPSIAVNRWWWSPTTLRCHALDAALALVARRPRL